MAKIRLRNTAIVPLNGKRPGEDFVIEVDEEGTPIDLYWRKRFRDGAIEKGYLTVLDPSSAGAVPPAPSKSSGSASAATPKK